jgi:protein transport protein SEC31
MEKVVSEEFPDDEDFFDQIEPAAEPESEAAPESEKKASQETDTKESETNAADSVEETDGDRAIFRALTTGQFSTVIDLCLADNRIADALMFANFSQQAALIALAEEAYFNTHKIAFVRNTLRPVMKNDFAALVTQSDLNDWKQTLAFLLTYSKANLEFVNQLGQRLMEAGRSSDSAFCYVCAGNIDGAAQVWVSSSTKNANPLVVLHHAIEKIATFAATLQRRGLQASSTFVADKYSAYATALTAQGNLSGALSFLTLSTAATGVTDENTRILMDRISRSLNARPPVMQQAAARHPPQHQHQNNRPPFSHPPAGGRPLAGPHVRHSPARVDPHRRPMPNPMNNRPPMPHPHMNMNPLLNNRPPMPTPQGQTRPPMPMPQIGAPRQNMGQNTRPAMPMPRPNMGNPQMNQNMPMPRPQNPHSSMPGPGRPAMPMPNPRPNPSVSAAPAPFNPSAVSAPAPFNPNPLQPAQSPAPAVASAGPRVMSQQEAQVMGVLDALVNALSQTRLRPHETKRLEDVRQKMSVLRMQMPFSTSLVNGLGAVSAGLQGKDFNAATRAQTSLVTDHWKAGKDWLPALKRLIMLAKTYNNYQI